MTRLPQRQGASLHVLVVDDSAVVREVTATVLARQGFSVATASDPLIAMERMRQRRPDVLLLDLEMPRMDGLTFLRKLMEEDPLPVVVCSSLAGAGCEAGVEALQAGALEIVAKPRLGIRDFLSESALMLGDALRGAASARTRSSREPRGPALDGGLDRLGPCSGPTDGHPGIVGGTSTRPGSRAHLPRLARDAEGGLEREGTDAPLPVSPRESAPALRRTTEQVVALGASTGGTEALRQVLRELPAESPGIVVVQHMPAGFTAAFAAALASTCRLEVREAADGDRVRRGTALIAPGNRHLELVRSGALYRVRVFDGPPVSRHRPSVDVLFRSAAAAAGPNALGVIMTGMGDDGADGLLAMRNAGATTAAQDEASCVVFGMPRCAIERGAASEVVALENIPGLIARFACSGSRGETKR